MKNKNLFVTTKKEIVYQNKWSSVTKTNIENENLKKEIFTTNFGKRSAVIVYADEKVLLTKQYRLLIDNFSWEIPGGRVEDSESFVEAATRECKEETGYDCISLVPLISFQPGLETLNNPTEIFLCRDFKKYEISENAETVKSSWFSCKEAQELLRKGFFLDSLTIIGLQALFLKDI
jgi:8-oxo-dGTP pyrophosphatase MutT (NUDIX family)